MIIGLLLVMMLEAMGRPLILELLDFSSFLVAFFVSFTLYNLPAKFFADSFKIPHGLSLVIGFMTAWFISELLFYLLVRLILPKIPPVKIAGEKFMSMVPAFLRGLIFIALALVLLGTFPIQPGIKQAVADSKLGSLILRNAYQIEQPVKQVFGEVSNDSLTFLTVEPKADESIDLGFQTDKYTTDTVSEDAMIDLVNKERTSRGIKALTFDPRLRDVARGHSEDMLRRGYFSHYSPEGKTVADRATSAGIDFLVIGENLAYAPTLQAAHNGLMNSPGHKANILSTDYTKIGIGVMDAGVYGKMFTQVFKN